MLNFALHAPLMPSVKCTFPDIYQQLLKCCYITHAFQGTCESTAGEQIITMQRGKNQGFFFTNPRLLKTEKVTLVWTFLDQDLLKLNIWYLGSPWRGCLMCCVLGAAPGLLGSAQLWDSLTSGLRTPSQSPWPPGSVPAWDVSSSHSPALPTHGLCCSR